MRPDSVLEVRYVNARLLREALSNAANTTSASGILAWAERRRKKIAANLWVVGTPTPIRFRETIPVPKSYRGLRIQKDQP